MGGEYLDECGLVLGAFVVAAAVDLVGKMDQSDTCDILIVCKYYHMKMRKW